MIRGLLAFACRAFPREHRARQSDEVVDTAVLASRGSTLGALREALSLVGAGLWQRLRSEPGRSFLDGVRLLAGVLAVVNLAVAVAGVILAAQSLPIYHSCVAVGPCAPMLPFVVDWWWIAFTAAAAGIVFGLALGNRRLAAFAAIANLGLIAYDALVLVDPDEWFTGHLAVFSYGQPSAFPAGKDWLAGAIVLALATTAVPLRRATLTNLAPALVATAALVVLSQEIPGRFLFVLWPLAALFSLAIALGRLAPRLVVLAVGGIVVALPGVVGLKEQSIQHHPYATWAVAAALAIGILLPLAQMARRRLT